MTSPRGVSPVKKPRGRPRTLKRLGVKKDLINIKPRLLSDEESLLCIEYKSHCLPGMPCPKLSETSLAFLDPALSQMDIFDNSSSPSHQATSATPMNRSRRRPWDQRIRPQQELIRPFCVLKSDPSREDHWVKLPRVLLSTIQQRSSISAQRLNEINGILYPWKMWEYHTHLGSQKALGFAHITVTLDPHSGETPYHITVIVLEDPPLQGGVDFTVGQLDLHAVYNGNWRPDWAANQYVLHNNQTGIGHNTLREIEILQSKNWDGPLCPPPSYFT
ncbi:hypothetical protein V8F06_000607 [Rhypophila decipiens]